MKKMLAVAALLLLCAGCGARNSVIGLELSEVESVEVYSYAVPKSAEKKTVTGESDIKAILDAFAAVRVKGDGANAEPMNGGACEFVFNARDGGTLHIIRAGKTLSSPGGFWYEVSGAGGVDRLWGTLRYDAEKVAEYELPSYPKDRVPYLGLRFQFHGDYYNIGVQSGTSGWSHGEADGSTLHVESDSPHPLDTGYALMEVEPRDGVAALELSFDIPPTAYSVRRWPDVYIGNAAENDALSEKVAVSGGSIDISDGDTGYVYEVYAQWPQGYAHYAFRVRGG